VSSSDLLFNNFDMFAMKEGRKRQVVEEVDAIPVDRLLNTPVDSLVSYFVDKIRIEVPTLREDQITTDQRETKIDVSRDPLRMLPGRPGPVFISGSEVSYYIPFDGDAGLFRVQPSSFTLNPPRGELNGQELILRFEAQQHDANRLKTEFENLLSTIRQYLGWLNRDAEPFNRELETLARQRITSRCDRIRQERGTVASLGYPLRRRAGAPETFVVPTVRRKATPQMPAATGAGKSEPTLDAAEYESILKIITNMVDVMERSPHAFRGMSEPDLRQHFLVQLNGQYEGQATGETFNFEGKTDILIRAEGKNIFIAECAIWHGPEKFREKIDQLLGYATWRDSKLALLVFNRGKQLSVVLSKIVEVVKTHPNFKREVAGYKSDRGFRYTVHHRDDAQRELTLTVLVFEVPT